MSEDQSVLNALAFLYIGFAHSTDGELAPEEMKTLAAHIKEWQPEAELGTIGEVLAEGVALYKATDPVKRVDAFRKHGEALKAHLDANARLMVLADLEAISRADGEISQGEREFIAAMKQILEVEG